MGTVLVHEPSCQLPVQSHQMGLVGPPWLATPPWLAARRRDRLKSGCRERGAAREHTSCTGHRWLVQQQQRRRQ